MQRARLKNLSAAIKLFPKTSIYKLLAQAKMNTNDELKEMPQLQKLQGQSPFKAPEGYFEQLSSSIQDRIASKNNTKAIKVFQPQWLIAFVFLGMIASGIYLRYSANENTQQQEMANVTADDIIESGYYTEIDEALLADAIPASQEEVQDSTAEMEEYILNNTDETTLINSL
jgi:hypothetical protein